MRNAPAEAISFSLFILDPLRVIRALRVFSASEVFAKSFGSKNDPEKAELLGK